MIALNHVYIFEEKIYIRSYFIVLLLQSVQFALIAVLQKSYMKTKCKLQQLQRANEVIYCSFSYSPLLIFLIILLVVRLTNIYITDLSDRPTSFPAWMASVVENKAGTLSSNSFFCGSMLSINMNLCMFE